MKYIFCIDNKKGMMFFGKRQSQDSALREWILNHVQGSNLYMSSYSARQFEGASGFISDDNYENTMSVGDYCFVEDKGYSLNLCSEVIICKWNRKYQADKFFNEDLKSEGFTKVSSEDITGSSHEKITIEIWRRM